MNGHSKSTAVATQVEPAFGLSQPEGYEIERPKDKPIFDEASRIAYLQRANNALVGVRPICAARCDQTIVGADGKRTRVVYFPAGSFALTATV